MVNRKRKKVKIIRKQTRSPWALAAVLVALVALAYGYSVLSYNDAILSLKNEYREIIKEEKKYAKAEGQVLSVKIEKSIRLPIILYHYVEVVKDDKDTIRKSLNINPYIFEKQLKDLKDHNYKTYFVKDIPGIFKGKVPYTTKSVILTFDDGYEDFYTDAFPLLKKYNTKATLYVVHSFIGQKGFLNKEQLSEIIKSGLVEIGSHAVNHINMAAIAPEHAKWQIFQSKTLLEELLKIKIDTFAYPYGGFDEKTSQFVKEASYSAAVSVVPGSYQSKDVLFFLPRYRAGTFIDNTVKTLEALEK